VKYLKYSLRPIVVIFAIWIGAFLCDWLKSLDDSKWTFPPTLLSVALLYFCVIIAAGLKAIEIEGKL